MIISYAWYNRLGNNIIQLSNIIDIALEYKHNIVFKKNLTFFNLKIIEKFFNKYHNNKILVDKYNFQSYTCRYKIKILDENIKIRNNLLLKAFLIKNINELQDHDVVVHIRSGDIFSVNTPINYAPPPLEYYIDIIDKNKYKNIIIVCEDKVNPIVNELLKKYKNSVHNINSLEKDIRLILGAKNIISSVGTFVHYLLLLSKYIKNYFRPDKKKLEKYYDIMFPWKNTKKQIQCMLTFKSETQKPVRGAKN